MVWNLSSFVVEPNPKYFYYSPLFPNPVICLRDIAFTGSKQVYTRLLPWNGVSAWVKETNADILTLLEHVDVDFLLLSAIVGVFLTLLRILLDKVVFQVRVQISFFFLFFFLMSEWRVLPV